MTDNLQTSLRPRPVHGENLRTIRVLELIQEPDHSPARVAKAIRTYVKRRPGALDETFVRLFSDFAERLDAGDADALHQLAAVRRRR